MPEPTIRERAQWNVDSLVTLSELHQRRFGHAVPYQRDLEAALRTLKAIKCDAPITQSQQEKP